MDHPGRRGGRTGGNDGSAWAQKPGGVLKIQHMDTPPSASIHEEATVSTAVPFMGLYNNLVIFDQNVAKNSFDSIVPDLATKWAWSADGKQLAFTLRQGVKWHDGKPFTAKDVACTFEHAAERRDQDQAQSARRLVHATSRRSRPTATSHATFHLKERQPALLALLASGYTPIYPCHIPSADMRRKPIGTGPFKLAEFKMNEGIKLVKNPDYWKPGRPYLDGIEYTIIADRSTRMLSFASGKFDMTFPTDLTVPLYKNMMQRRAAREVHHARHRRQHQPDRQSRGAAVRRSEDPPRAGADARSPGLHRHPERGREQHGRRHAAAALRRAGACRRRC